MLVDQKCTIQTNCRGNERAEKPTCKKKKHEFRKMIRELKAKRDNNIKKEIKEKRNSRNNTSKLKKTQQLSVKVHYKQINN